MERQHLFHLGDYKGIMVADNSVIIHEDTNVLTINWINTVFSIDWLMKRYNNAHALARAIAGLQICSVNRAMDMLQTAQENDKSKLLHQPLI